MSRNKPAAAAVVEEEVEIVGPFKTKKEIKKFFTSLDRRKTKRVCEDDFVEGLLSQLNYLNVEKAQLEAFWRTFTQDKNGEVDLKGFQHRLLPVKEPTEEGKESKRTATKVKDKETSSSSSRGGAKKAEQKQSEVCVWRSLCFVLQHMYLLSKCCLLY
jgi:hypothetical protein